MTSPDLNSGILAMGGYARFVWPSFAVALIIFVWNLWSAGNLHAAAKLRVARAAAMAPKKRA